MSKKILLGMVILFASLSARANDSLNVRTVGNWPFGNTYSAATCSIGGHHIAVVGNGGGIMTVNIDTPSCPRWLGEVAIGGFPINQLQHPRNIKVYGNYAYLSLSESGMGIVDISDPENPAICSQTLLDGRIIDLVVYGNYAYAADDSCGLRVFDITNPADPSEVMIVPNTAACLGLALKDTILLANIFDPINEYPTLISYSLNQPENPTMLDSLNWVSLGQISINGNILFSAYYSSIDIQDPANLIPINIEPILTISNCKISTNDTLAFSPNIVGFDGFYITSIADPANPYILSSYDTPGYAREICYDNDLLYVSDDFGGLRIIDISAPSTPVEIGAFNAPSRYEGGHIEMNTRNNYLYYPMGDLYMLDISDTAMPKTAKWGKALGTSNAIALKDSIIISIDDSFGFKTFKEDNSKYLFCIDSSKVSGTYKYAWDIYCLDSLALVVSSDSFFIFNISASGNCQRLGQCLLTSGISEAVSVSAIGQYAYASAGHYGLYVINISDPASPVITDSLNIGMAWDQIIKNDKIFIANHSNGLRILDIAAPDSPIVFKTYNTPGCAMALAIDSSFAYVADDSAGIRIININNPDTLFESGYYALETVSFPYTNRAMGVAVDNGNIFVSHYFTGVKVYKYYGPDAGVSSNDHNSGKKPLTFLLRDAYPNPARNRTNISYQLPNKSTVKLNLYNITGQLVQSMNIGIQQPGYYNMPLKTEKLSSGVYFYQLIADNDNRTGKIVILK